MKRSYLYKEARAHLRGLSTTEIRSLVQEVINEKYLERANGLRYGLPPPATAAR